MASAAVNQKEKEKSLLSSNKKYIIAAGAIIAILMFMLEPLQYGGGLSIFSAKPDAARNITAEAFFNGTIRTYDPLLFIPLDTPEAVMGQLRSKDGILDIQQEGSSYLARTETRDDVYPLYQWLRLQNATAFAIANVALSGQIVAQTPSGMQNASIMGGVVRVVTEPLVDAGTDVSVRMVAVMRGNAIIDYSSAELDYGERDLLLDATVESIDSQAYYYTVPWESRNSIDLLPYPEHEYARVDTVVFTSPLDVPTIMAKKQFPYITYIDSGSAQVSPSFDNLTMLEANFADTPFTLPPSRLTILSDELPEIPFTPEVTYIYTLRLAESGYDFGDGLLALESDEKYDVGSTLQVNISAVMLGDRVISVRRAALPS